MGKKKNKKTRTKPPKKVQDKVLSEFNHRCSKCGADKPQLHHIDEDPSNHDPMNMLPLCPNCHLTDSHNPTAPISPGKLRLFRMYKDPAILKPQFHPIFIRMAPFLRLDVDVSAAVLSARVHELVSFLSEFKMGSYYSNRVLLMLKEPRSVSPAILENYSNAIPGDDYQRLIDEEHIAKVKINWNEAEYLIIEMLRYQNWPNDRPNRFAAQ